MLSYKEWWIANYERLSMEMFDREYFELSKDELAQLDKAITDASANYIGDMADLLRDRMEDR